MKVSDAKEILEALRKSVATADILKKELDSDTESSILDEDIRADIKDTLKVFEQNYPEDFDFKNMLDCVRVLGLKYQDFLEKGINSAELKVSYPFLESLITDKKI